MNTTKILGEAVGIQRQDIVDQTEEQLADSLNGAAILGRFKRGRLDKPITIHQGNIRGQLGYEPNNPDYIAVQDCLDAGVPNVQVLRISGGALICQKLVNVDNYRQFIVRPDLTDAGQQEIDKVLDALIESGRYTINEHPYQLKNTYYVRTDEYIDISISRSESIGEFNEVEFCASVPFIFEAWYT
ncbi:hypothetical protein [Acinetobacter pragensis]|uniref:hypothetical protein n=1 Tax=Acinetobacter pragensis TaxID=1806892 RepID=UPI000A45853F|nr:hypothetical protein [Acinetobacter pragensis]